jgi:hypothetical protein
MINLNILVSSKIDILLLKVVISIDNDSFKAVSSCLEKRSDEEFEDLNDLIVVNNF